MDIEGFRQRELARAEEIETIEEFLTNRLLEAAPVIQTVSGLLLGIVPEDLRWAYDDASKWWELSVTAGDDAKRPIEFNSYHGHVGVDARWFKGEMSHQEMFELALELFYDDMRTSDYDNDAMAFLEENQSSYRYAQREVDAGRMTADEFAKMKETMRGYECRLHGIIAITEAAREKTLDEWFDYAVTENFFDVSA